MSSVGGLDQLHKEVTGGGFFDTIKKNVRIPKFVTYIIFAIAILFCMGVLKWPLSSMPGTSECSDWNLKQLELAVASINAT
jgi:hypothetical protein